MSDTRMTDFAPESRPEDAARREMADGDPELHVYMNRMVKVGGRVLDLAAGELRNSRMFAMQAMDVVAVDANADSLRRGYGSLEPQLRERITTAHEDVDSFLRRQIAGNYDVVLMSEFPNHAGSRVQALDIARRAYDTLSPDGYFWLRTISTLDDSYRRLRVEAASHSDSLVKQGIEDDHTFHAVCNCSGERKLEPQTFFEPYDIHDALELPDDAIVYQRIAPTVGYPNIMGGRHLSRPDHEGRQFGYISLLAQKPA